MLVNTIVLNYYLLIYFNKYGTNIRNFHNKTSVFLGLSNCKSMCYTVFKVEEGCPDNIQISSVFVTFCTLVI